MPTGVPQLATWPSSGTSANKEAFQQSYLITGSILEEQNYLKLRVILQTMGQPVQRKGWSFTSGPIKDVENYLGLSIQISKSPQYMKQLMVS